MKKILLIMVLLCGMAFAKPFVVDVCRNGGCYTYKLSDVKDYRYITDMNGRKYLRLTMFNKNLLDIYVDGMTVKIGK